MEGDFERATSAAANGLVRMLIGVEGEAASVGKRTSETRFGAEAATFDGFNGVTGPNAA